MYPILLDVSERLCVIVGGGAVAGRKAKGLFSAGAKRVRMIAPDFVADAPDGVEKIRERYRLEHLNGAGLVFAATNVGWVNDAVVRDAKARNILVSRVDGDEARQADFVTPAKFDRGTVTIAVSAGSAALSVMIRDELESRWEPAWDAMAEAMQTLRPQIKVNWNEPTRRKIFHDLATQQAMEVLASGGVEALRDWIDKRFGAGG